jgi:Predicted membrane protein
MKNRNRDILLLRTTLIIIFFFFGYAKWFSYEANGIAVFISNSPLIAWMHNIAGIRGASYLLGGAEWLFGLMLLLGYWFSLPGLLGAAGSTLTFIVTSTFLFSTPGAVVPEAGGFPALSSTEQFLLKDVVLLAASLILLRYEWYRRRGVAPLTDSTEC